MSGSSPWQVENHLFFKCLKSTVVILKNDLYGLFCMCFTTVQDMHSYFINTLKGYVK